MLRKLLTSFERSLSIVSSRRSHSADESDPGDLSRAYLTLSDGDLAVILAQKFAPARSPYYEFIEQTQHLLQENPYNKRWFLEEMFDLFLTTSSKYFSHDPERVWIMGTDSYLNQKVWAARAAELGYSQGCHTIPSIQDLGKTPFRHSGIYDASIIVSLYKAGPYIEHFLDQICRQTALARTEVIIIDAASPDKEEKVIDKYRNIFGNIVYRRLEYCISVYEAWNTAIHMARGRYLTNANVDDFRRADSVELQIAALDGNPDVDIVYQDVFYTLEPNMHFADIEAFGYKTNLPIITANNLHWFNSPHNAPMWRRKLHGDIGLFDTSFVSAADWHFWIRCLLSKKRFLKINTPHVGYYQNPAGISTSANSRSIAEGRRIQSEYGRSLISTNFTSSISSFFRLVGIEPEKGKPAAVDDLYGSPRYDIVQTKLLSIAKKERRVCTKKRSVNIGTKNKPTVVVDGIAFSLLGSTICRAWYALIGCLAANEELDILLLDRGKAPTIPKVEIANFPAYTHTNTPADSFLLEQRCRDAGADVFLSTFFTTPTTVPTVQLSFDIVPQAIRDADMRIFQEKSLALNFARSVLCFSENTRKDLISLYPHLEQSIELIELAIDSQAFHPREQSEIDAFCRGLGIRNRFFSIHCSPDLGEMLSRGTVILDALKQLDVGEPFDLVFIGGVSDDMKSRLGEIPKPIGVHQISPTAIGLSLVYSGSLASIFPSPYQGLGLSIAEAIACGSPIITADRGWLPGRADNSVTLVPQCHVDALRDAIVHHLNSNLDRARRLPSIEQSTSEWWRWDVATTKILNAVRTASRAREVDRYLSFSTEWERLRALQAEVDWRQAMPKS